ncbi:hypothetical protein C8R41DRAFT_863425 [Lentinula lateritia]|uniref:Kinesin motor domain-containing protein n=1 Tax=Lentinula lateritia TaxID=40482 RepID=A0ABQ8VUN5_9AGAR|nr:hypothetical protein C8R41DRAFT_863425 [Lentinula lateritia]
MNSFISSGLPRLVQQSPNKQQIFCIAQNRVSSTFYSQRFQLLRVIFITAVKVKCRLIEDEDRSVDDDIGVGVGVWREFESLGMGTLLWEGSQSQITYDSGLGIQGCLKLPSAMAAAPHLTFNIFSFRQQMTPKLRPLPSEVCDDGHYIPLAFHSAYTPHDTSAKALFERDVFPLLDNVLGGGGGTDAFYDLLVPPPQRGRKLQILSTVSRGTNPNPNPNPKNNNNNTTSGHTIHLPHLSTHPISSIAEPHTLYIPKSNFTGNDPQRAAINTSLSALGQGAGALNEGSGGSGARIPYHSSNLTRLLSDALGGTLLALLIVCLAPGIKFRGDLVRSVNQNRLWAGPNISGNNCV